MGLGRLAAVVVGAYVGGWLGGPVFGVYTAIIGAFAGHLAGKRVHEAAARGAFNGVLGTSSSPGNGSATVLGRLDQLLNFLVSLTQPLPQAGQARTASAPAGANAPSP